MKRLPKYTPAEVRNDPYGFTYKEMSEVIGENEAKALYEELYKQLPRKKNLSMLVKNICKSCNDQASQVATFSNILFILLVDI